MIENLRLTKEYYKLCEEFNNIYLKYIAFINDKMLDDAEKLIPELRAINARIQEVQKKLNAISDLSIYSKEEGVNINIIASRLDEFISRYKEFMDDSGERVYKNDGISDTRSIPAQDAQKAAEAWGEGYEPLTNFLETCIKNGIPTYGCCSGHSEYDFSYILFSSYDEQTLELTDFTIQNKLADRISVWENQGSSLLGIYISMENREDFYSAVDGYIKTHPEKEKNQTDRISTIAKLRDLIHKAMPDMDVTYYISEELFEMNLDSKSIVLTQQEVEEKIFSTIIPSVSKNKKTLFQKLKDSYLESTFGIGRIKNTASLLKEELDRDIEDEDTREL
ncbi:MAG: hypothetical protein IKF17_02480 [Clostridia bacterium]|nr:hypothetical protein [Clostridia bacterium]